MALPGSTGMQPGIESTRQGNPGRLMAVVPAAQHRTTPTRRLAMSVPDKPTSMADKPTELSEQVLDAVKEGQQAAIEAVRKFVSTVDQALPRVGEAPSHRQQVIDSGLEMADRLVEAQYDFLRNIV